jgi:hypothetical protein
MLGYDGGTGGAITVSCGFAGRGSSQTFLQSAVESGKEEFFQCCLKPRIRLPAGGCLNRSFDGVIGHR